MSPPVETCRWRIAAHHPRARPWRTETRHHLLTATRAHPSLIRFPRYCSPQAAPTPTSPLQPSVSVSGDYCAIAVRLNATYATCRCDVHFVVSSLSHPARATTPSLLRMTGAAAIARAFPRSRCYTANAKGSSSAVRRLAYLGWDLRDLERDAHRREMRDRA
jgi:hypothetical protein